MSVSLVIRFAKNVFTKSVLLVFVLFLLGVCTNVWADEKTFENLSRTQIDQLSYESILSYVNIQIAPTTPVLITGEHGSLCIKISLDSVNQNRENKIL
jgi:predicted component of type VI protein secretion system